MPRMNLNETMNRLLLLIRAGYPVIYIVSLEESRVLDYLGKIVRIIKKENPQKNLLKWYGNEGFHIYKNLAQQAQDCEWVNVEGLSNPDGWQRATGNGNPIDDLEVYKRALNTNNPDLADSVAVFFDMHQLIRQFGPLVRPIRNAADMLRKYYDSNRQTHYYKTIVIVSPTSEVSSELEKDLIKIDFPLPEEDELKMTLNKMIANGHLHYETNASSEVKVRLCERIAGAGRGLTLEDYKLGLNGFAVRENVLKEQHIKDMLDLKAKAINNEALQYTPHVDINLGGLAEVKDWIRIRREAVASSSIREKYHLNSPKGALLCGVSGGGKSQLAKLIAKEFSLALLRLDVGALFGQYVGESEEKTRKALQLAEVLAPVVLWIDELDKAFVSVGGGGDSGVSARVFGYFLTWLAEKQDSIFVVATANDFRKLFVNFPEFARKGRFNEIFWIGLPTDESRREIFKIYLKPLYDSGYLSISDDQLNGILSKFEAPVKFDSEYKLDRLCQLLGNTRTSTNMTGAEIENAVEESLYEAYRLSIEEGSGLTPRLIFDTVKKVKDRALYKVGGTAEVEKNNMETVALNNHWLFAK